MVLTHPLSCLGHFCLYEGSLQAPKTLYHEITLLVRRWVVETDRS